MDGIKQFVLKKYATELAPPLTQLFQRSFDKSIFSGTIHQTTAQYLCFNWLANWCSRLWLMIRSTIFAMNYLLKTFITVTLTSISSWPFMMNIKLLFLTFQSLWWTIAFKSSSQGSVIQYLSETKYLVFCYRSDKRISSTLNRHLSSFSQFSTSVPQR